MANDLLNDVQSEVEALKIIFLHDKNGKARPVFPSFMFLHRGYIWDDYFKGRNETTIGLHEIEVGDNTYNHCIETYFAIEIDMARTSVDATTKPEVRAKSLHLGEAKPFKLKLENQVTVNSFPFFTFQYGISADDQGRPIFTLENSRITDLVRYCPGGFSSFGKRINCDSASLIPRARLAGKEYDFSKPRHAAKFMMHFDRLADDEVWDHFTPGVLG